MEPSNENGIVREPTTTTTNNNINSNLVDPSVQVSETAAPSDINQNKRGDQLFVVGMQFNKKKGFSKMAGDGAGTSRDQSSSSAASTLDGQGRPTKKTVFIPRAKNNASDVEDDGCETDSSMPSEETPLRRRKIGYDTQYAKLAVAVTLVFACTFINGLVIAYINRFSVNEPQSLPDIVFNFVPQQTWAWETADIIVIVCPLFAFAVLLLHKHYTIVYTRLCVLAAMLYFMRALFLLCTYLPPPFLDYQQRCLPANFTDDTVQLLASAMGLVFRVGFSSDQTRFMCGDTIFSGHALVFTLVGLFLWQDTPRLLRPFPAILVTCATVFGLTCVLIARQHYTIDIVVAIFVTWSTFRLFHRWTLTSRQRRCFSFKPFRFRPVYAFFLLFERDVPRGRLPADFAWPLPGPALIVLFFDRLNRRCGGSNNGGSATSAVNSSADELAVDVISRGVPPPPPVAVSLPAGFSSSISTPQNETADRRATKSKQQFDV